MFLRNQGGNASMTRPYLQGRVFIFLYIIFRSEIPILSVPKHYIRRRKGWEA